MVAALGPTNTGKTHQAIERMLEHRSGMIGLPLRLLAREVYDRISVRLGESEVALITGEERRVTGKPRFWVCTVEAMPRDLEVDFVAVDEVQLAAHWERGHIYSDRILRMRGRKETWFLGSDTIRPVLRGLLPDARFRTEQRFSQLRSAGRKSLRSLPPRSAVVAFSVERVYSLAERIRYLRGGTAVVLGALSPRTRNAQVALYQSGEVQYMVATDAIGMGLNLDIDHVGFADLRKFDGKQHRPLRTAELAQIAGRAGRYQNDGTFGTVRPLPALDDRVARNIEEHRFPPLRQLMWRNPSLDFGSVDALLASLAVHPSRRELQRTTDNDDTRALFALSERRDIRKLASDPASVALLWEVCQVPDFEKLLVFRHVKLLGEIFVQLCKRGTIDAEWLRNEVDHVDNLQGGIDMLTTRLSLIRRWTYVSHRSHWLEDPAYWQARTREVEDRLGDALHHRLVERFVEQRRSWSGSRSAPVVEPSSPFAALERFRLQGNEEPSQAEAWIERLVECSHAALEIDDRFRVRFEDELLGCLVAGRSLLEPTVRIQTAVPLSPSARIRVERRLLAFTRDLVNEVLSPMRAEAAEELTAPGRGLIYQLEQNLGTVTRRDAGDQLELLSRRDRSVLARLGVATGRRLVFVRELVTPGAIRRRRLLCALLHADAAALPGLELAPPILDLDASLEPRAGGDVDQEDDREEPTESRRILDLDLDDRDYLSLGYLRVEHFALRSDAVEELAQRFAPRARGRRPESISNLARWLGLRSADIRLLLSSLRLHPRRGRRRRRPPRPRS